MIMQFTVIDPSDKTKHVLHIPSTKVEGFKAALGKRIPEIIYTSFGAYVLDRDTALNVGQYEAWVKDYGGWR